MPTWLNDPNTLSLISNVIALVSLLVAAVGLFAAFHPILKARRDRRILLRKLRRGPVARDTIVRSTQYFIRPKCSNIDPAQEEELRHALTATREDLFKKVDEFIEIDTPKRHLLILADSGTGKTTFALNYLVYNERKAGKNSHAVAYVPLGYKSADELIREIPEKESTVLILDAFDEDTNAIHGYRDRIRELMEMCRPFMRVIITCRTQFFKKDEEIPVDTGIVRFGPRKADEKGTFEFRKLYLSPFSERDVKRYFAKVYRFWRYRTRRKALEIADRIPNLKVRPMLLAHIPDLIKQKRTFNSVIELYEVMIKAWLVRESEWINEEILRDFSERVAIEIFAGRERRGMERIPVAELPLLADDWGIRVEEWKLSGRSLLNRDGDGNFKFAHRSIMEYLFVVRFLKLPEAERPVLKWTDQMKEFLCQMICLEKPRNLQNVDASGVDFSGMDLSSCMFSGANLEDCMFSGANLEECGLDGCVMNVSLANNIHFDDDQLKAAKWINPITGMEFSYISPGEFMMGSPENEPERYDNEKQHKVILTEGFFMQTTPVTQGQWKAVMGKNPSYFKNGGDDCPVESVSWDNVQLFISKLNGSEGAEVLRLPTEVQWEYACRAGTTTRYHTGDSDADIARAGWYEKNSGGKTHPVGQKEANAFGLHDMHGNVWEWCADWFGGYPSGPVTDPTGPESGSLRVLRGGSWNNGARNCRSAYRNNGSPSLRYYYVGFRLALSPGR